MKLLEIRRHSHRDREGNLSSDGRRLADLVGRSLNGPFVSCYSSPRKRAVQTMEAFGCPHLTVEELFDLLNPSLFAPYQEEVEAVMHEKGISILEGYFAVPQTLQSLEEEGERIYLGIKEIVTHLPEGGKALAVSHGGTIEAAALYGLGKEFNLSLLGGEFEPCEGVRFLFQKEHLVALDLLRIPKQVTGE